MLLSGSRGTCNAARIFTSSPHAGPELYLTNSEGLPSPTNPAPNDRFVLARREAYNNQGVKVQVIPKLTKPDCKRRHHT